MSYDPVLAERIRLLLRENAAVSEKKMFGGVAFFINGHMTVVASHQGGILVRINPADTAKFERNRNVRMAEMRGRTLKGWLRVQPAGIRTSKQLQTWVTRGLGFVSSLEKRSG